MKKVILFFTACLLTASLTSLPTRNANAQTVTYSSPEAAKAALIADGWTVQPYPGTVAVEVAAGNQAVRFKLSQIIPGAVITILTNCYGPNPTSGALELQSAAYIPNIYGNWSYPNAGFVLMPLQAVVTSDPFPYKWCQYINGDTSLQSANYFSFNNTWDASLQIVDVAHKISYIVPYFHVNVASPPAIVYAPAPVPAPAPAEKKKGAPVKH